MEEDIPRPRHSAPWAQLEDLLHQPDQADLVVGASAVDLVVDLEAAAAASEVGEASAVVTAADTVADAAVLVTRVVEALVEEEVGTEAVLRTAHHPQTHQLDLVAAVAMVVGMAGLLMVV